MVCLLGSAGGLAALMLAFGLPVALLTHAFAERMELP